MNLLSFMIVVIIIDQPKEVSAATVRISGNITDFQNTNGKEIECSFTGSFDRIIFLAKNKSSSCFESIAYSKSNENPNLTLTEFGNYIFGNVTTSFKSKSKSILFNGLSCLHVREYKCRIWIEQSDGDFMSKESTIMNITIKVRPSKPEMSFTTQVFSSTTNQNENSTNSATNNTRLKRSSPFMSNKSINDRAFTEGDNITFTCDGDVGRPKGKFLWQKIYSNKRRINYTSIPTETIPENCTYSGTSKLTIQVTAEDNHAKMRCIVKSDVSEVDMSADSQPLLIYFQVREPDISVQPNETVHKEGELVRLNCKGYGNPNPSYSWTKGNISDETISDNDTLVIKNVNISDNGLFTCNTSNEINGEIYSASRSRDIIIVKVPSVVRINQNITKREHSNGIKLNCSYDMGSQDTFESIALAAQNISADQFQDTAGRRRNTNQTLTAFGVYLFGNATTVLKSENALMLEFNNLARRHERLYKCILNVYPHDDPFNPERIESDVMNITVTAEESTTTDSEHKTETIVVMVVVAVIVPGIVLLVLVVVVIGVIRRRTRTQASLLPFFDDDIEHSQNNDTYSEDNQQDTPMYDDPQQDVKDTSGNKGHKKEKNCEQLDTVNNHDNIRPSTTVSSMENMDEMLKYRNANSCDNYPDHYASSVPGIYDALHDKRHKTNNGETFDRMFELKSLPENRNESIERNTSIEHQDSTMFNCHTSPLEKSKPGGYESVVIEGDVPALSSEGNGSVHGDIEIVRQHNKEYLQNQKEEEKKLNKSPISTQPVEYAQVNETTMLKNEKKQIDTDQETVDTNAEIHEGIQVESEERHAKTENDDHLDKTKIISKENSDVETKSSVKSKHIICDINPTFEHDSVSSQEEKIKVAMVSPTIRSSGSSAKHQQKETTNAETKDRINFSQKVDDDDESCNTTKSMASSEDNKQKENKNAEIQQGINVRSGRTVDNVSYFDTTINLKKQQTNGNPESSKNNDQIGSYINRAFDREEKQEVNAVSVTLLTVDGLQDDGERNQNNDKKSKNGYENFESTDQTETSKGDTIH